MRRAHPEATARTILALTMLALLVAGCDRGQAPPPPEDPRRPAIQLASFDFPESEILGELYGQALRQHSFPVELVVRLGAREVVAPALEQGKVDMVPEYLGSALNFLNDRDQVATRRPGARPAPQRAGLRPPRVSVLAYAPAVDRSGFVVTGEMARSRGLEKLSDWPRSPASWSSAGRRGAPAPLCLKGLQEVYKLEFERFEAKPSRDVTAAELKTGEIDIGMIDTSTPTWSSKATTWSSSRTTGFSISSGRQRRPGPPRVLDAYGPALVRLVNAVGAQLTTRELTGLNLQVDGGQPAADAAARWLQAHTIISCRGPSDGGPERGEDAGVGDEGGDEGGQVTRQAGFQTPAASGASWAPASVLTSAAGRCSISMAAPSAASGSNDDSGPTT